MNNFQHQNNNSSCKSITSNAIHTKPVKSGTFMVVNTFFTDVFMLITRIYWSILSYMKHMKINYFVTIWIKGKAIRLSFGKTYEMLRLFNHDNKLTYLDEFYQNKNPWLSEVILSISRTEFCHHHSKISLT